MEKEDFAEIDRFLNESESDEGPTNVIFGGREGYMPGLMPDEDLREIQAVFHHKRTPFTSFMDSIMQISDFDIDQVSIERDGSISMKTNKGNYRASDFSPIALGFMDFDGNIVEGPIEAFMDMDKARDDLSYDYCCSDEEGPIIDISYLLEQNAIDWAGLNRHFPAKEDYEPENVEWDKKGTKFSYNGVSEVDGQQMIKFSNDLASIALEPRDSSFYEKSEPEEMYDRGSLIEEINNEIEPTISLRINRHEEDIQQFTEDDFDSYADSPMVFKGQSTIENPDGSERRPTDSDALYNQELWKRNYNKPQIGVLKMENSDDSISFPANGEMISTFAKYIDKVYVNFT